MVHDEPFTPQHHEKAPVVEPATLLRDRLSAPAMRCRPASGLVANRHAATADGFKRPRSFRIAII